MRFWPFAPKELEIEKVCAPFRSVKPTNIFEGPYDLSEIEPGSEAASAVFPRMRAQMLQDIFRIFAGRMEVVRSRAGEFMSAGVPSVDGVFGSVMSVYDDSMTQASLTLPSFAETVEAYDHLHAGKGYAEPARNAFDEMRLFASHGTGVLTGFLEVAPYVYAQRVAKPTRTKIAELLSTSTDRMTSELSRVPGPFAIAVENRLKKSDRYVAYDEITHRRFVMDPSRFMMKIVDGKNILDIDARVAKAMRDDIVIRRHQYHGCLAGQVRMDGMPTSVFSYMRDLVSELLLQHAFQDIVE